MTDFDQEAATWDEKPYRIERAAAVAEGIRSNLPLTSQMTAFEYGCGTGLLSFALQPYLGHITLADSSSGMLKVLDEKIAAGGLGNMSSLQLDLITDPVPPLQMDLIYTLMTLHHIQDVERVLRSFYAMLNEDGCLFVADLDKEDGSFHGAGFDGHLGFDRVEFGEKARRAGFSSVSFETIYQTPKMIEGSIKTFPIFLMKAEKHK